MTTINENELTDMFGEGGKEEVKEYYNKSMTTQEYLADANVPAIYKEKYFRDEIDEEEFCKIAEKSLNYYWEIVDRAVDEAKV